jgi:CHASE3 domain sensor protein
VLAAAIAEKMSELGKTIALRRSGDSEGALDVVRTDHGKASMEHIRGVVGDMDAEERNLLVVREQTWRAAAAFSNVVNTGGTAILLVLIFGTAVLLSRDYKARETEAWLKTGQTNALLRLQG